MKQKLFIIALSLLPVLSFAQTRPDDIKSLVAFLLFYINKLIPIVFMMTFVVFIWGMATFIRKSDSEDGVKNGKRLILVSIIAFFVALSFRSLFTLIAEDLGIGSAEFNNPSSLFINSDEVYNVANPL